MITFTSTRHDGPHENTLVREMTTGRALTMLVQFELGWGGKVLETSSTRIVTQTYVLGHVDVDVFEGSEEDMQILLVATRVYYELLGATAEDSTMQALDVLCGDNGGYSPFDVETLGPLLVGGGYIKPALLAAAGANLAQMEAGLRQSIDDVVAAIEMGIDTDEIDVAFELLAA